MSVNHGVKHCMQTVLSRAVLAFQHSLETNSTSTVVVFFPSTSCRNTNKPSSPGEGTHTPVVYID